MTGSAVFDTVVRILGKSEITVENVCSLCEFDANSVTFRTKSGAIEIRGENFVITNAQEGSFALSGVITSVVYL